MCTLGNPVLAKSGGACRVDLTGTRSKATGVALAMSSKTLSGRAKMIVKV